MKIGLPPTIGAYASGILCAIAWFCLIDATVYNIHVRQGVGQHEVNFLNWLPAIIAIPGFILLNAIPIQNLSSDSGDEHDQKVVAWNRALLFVAFFILFGALLAGVIIMIVHLTNYNKQDVWLQVATLLHPMLITIAAFTYFLGKLIGDKLQFGSD